MIFPLTWPASEFQRTWSPILKGWLMVAPVMAEAETLLEQIVCLVHVERDGLQERSEEHTSELQSLLRSSYAVFCLKIQKHHTHHPSTLINLTCYTRHTYHIKTLPTNN